MKSQDFNEIVKKQNFCCKVRNSTLVPHTRHASILLDGLARVLCVLVAFL